MMDTLNQEKVSQIVKNTLASSLGLDPGDIEEDDSFTQDYHMGPIEVTDFIEELRAKDINVSSLDLNSIETLGDLMEQLNG